jgi:hypothetical protein
MKNFETAFPHFKWRVRGVHAPRIVEGAAWRTATGGPRCVRGVHAPRIVEGA